MKVLLVGEYSRLHNSLKEGLKELGHDVTIMASGDGFKNYPVDIKITHSFQKKAFERINSLIFRLFKIHLSSLELRYKAIKKVKTLKHFDVVQLINESSLKALPKHEEQFVEQLLTKTKKIFLLACGEDYTANKYLLEGKPRYSFMTPYLKDNTLKKTYQFQFYCVSEAHKKLHDYLMTKVRGIIASDLDYHLPYLKKPKYLGLIPNPINIDKINYIAPKIDGKIKIFHGVNKDSAHKKGNHYFFEALNIVAEKYADKIDIITVYSLPYNVYIEKYNSCHILLDQVYAYDQGYNALEAMAKGKVVFTGAEKEWLDHYGLKEDTVAINALPNAAEIAKKLEWLIQHPDKILAISKNARDFIEKHHNYKTVAKQYVDAWSNN